MSVLATPIRQHSGVGPVRGSALAAVLLLA